jgi:hypothetical protein
MFSVFVNLGGEQHYRGLVSNGEKDIFVKSVLENFGFDAADVVAHLYTDPKLAIFLAWGNDTQKSHRLYVDPVTYELQKILVYNYESTEKRYIEFTDEVVDPLDYYTQQEIDDHAHNTAVNAQWVIDNPAPDENSPLPDYLGVEWPTPKMAETIKEEKFHVIDSIAGTLIDVPARVIAEQDALDNDLTELP